MARGHDVVDDPKPHAVPEQVANGPPWRVDGGLIAGGRVEPGTVRPGDCASEVGHGRNQRWPSLGGCIVIGAVIAARMKTQRPKSTQSRDAAAAQIGFRDRAGQRLRHGEQPAGRFGRSCRSRRQGPAALRLGAWQAQKQVRLGEHVAHAIEPAVDGDEIEQVAVFARGGVSPLAGGALAAVRPLETDEQATSRRVRHIANEPVAALATTVGEIVAAHRLGIARETVSEICGFG